MCDRLVSDDDDYKILINIKNGNLAEQERKLLEKFPLNKFKGNFPIRILFNNFTESYNSLSSSAALDLKSLTENGVLDSRISYLISEDKFTTPCVHKGKLDKYIMEFGESYVAYTWCITYYLLLKYEYGIQVSINRCTPFCITDSMMERARELFLWAISLRSDVHVGWPENYPNPYPTSKLIDSEALYCLKVNSLSTRVVTFSMFHELGHVSLKHTTSSIEIEQEADNCAFDYMLNSMKASDEVTNCMAIIFGMGEMLFFCNSISDVHSSSHPDIHRRLNNALQRALDSSNGIEIELKFMVCVIYDVFFKLKGDVVDREFDDFDTCIENYESIIDTYC